MLRLYDIQDTIKTVTDAIASVMNMQVIICDTDLRRVGDSNKEWGPEDLNLTNHSILAGIMASDAPLVIGGKAEHPDCATCEYCSNCQIEALVGISIKYGSTVLGGIELIADTMENREILLKNTDHILNFLNKMAELIVSKLLEKDAANKLNIIREQLISIMNCIDDGIIALDENGFIVYWSSHFEKYLDLNSIGSDKQNIIDLFPQDYIRDLVLKDKPFRNRELSINRKELNLQTLVSGKPVKLKDRSIGAILTFKRMSDVFNVVHDISLGDIHTSFDDIIGDSSQIRSTKDNAKRIANSQSTILIQGESGTGKELLARAIHENSVRKNKPFIPINCAAIPDTLLESELFGYEYGAFTGAKRSGKTGKFQLAEGGTVFLDEIGEMPIHLQPKLLRVLQEKAVEKIGSQKSLPIDVRIITATNKNLEEMVENGGFREDLFYRLNVIPILIPPLRDRQGDIKILLKHFLKVYNAKLGKSIKDFSAEAESALLCYSWKGNVRELQNAVEYAVNMESSLYIHMESIPPRIRRIEKEPTKDNSIEKFDKMEKVLIQNALKRYGSDVDGKKTTAKSLGISLSTLYRKIKLYSIS